MKPRKPTDMRALRESDNRRMLVLACLLLLVGGSVIIGLFYGLEAAMVAMACLGGGVGLLLFVWLCVVVIGKIAGEDRYGR